MPYRDPGVARTHITYYAMLSRCYKPEHLTFPEYGGRGITVCERWRLSFSAFLDDMGVRPVGAQIDRIDTSGHYCLENCRWVTPSENSRNRRMENISLSGKSTIKAAKAAWIAQQRALTHCKHGHEFTPDNTYVRASGTRRCNRCAADRARRYRQVS